MTDNKYSIEFARRRLGDLVDVAQAGHDQIITRHGKSVARVTTTVETLTLPPLPEATRIAVADLIDATIEQEYGRGEALTAARETAHAALTSELRADYVARNGDDRGLADYVHLSLRILTRAGLAARTCQCRQLHPLGCSHGSASGSIWCDRHYEADVPDLNGALLCGTCHVGEYPA